MKSLSIKIGKALNVVKQDGIGRGSARIIKGFFAQFQRVRPGDVLFVTGGIGDSARYRARHQAEELNFHGIRASVVYADSPFLFSCANRFKIFVFHRTLFSPKIENFIREIKKQGKEIIFDTDDLLYDPVYLEQADYFKNINRLERKLYEKGLGSEIINDPYVRICTASTSYLADKLREKPARNAYGITDSDGDKKVFIVPNKLSRKDVETAAKILKANKANQAVKIGYFSGTKSHDKDFATIVGPLRSVLRKFANTDLVLVGPLDIDESFAAEFEDRIVKLPFVSRRKHFANLASVDINLAPLEVGDPFCESKSELKFFESGIVGVPTVAVTNRTFSEAIEDGKDGFLARSGQEWEDKIGRLVSDPEARARIGERARAKTLERYVTSSEGDTEYHSYLKEIINHE